eukprot:192704-Prymnesium_polylepis.1
MELVGVIESRDPSCGGLGMETFFFVMEMACAKPTIDHLLEQKGQVRSEEHHSPEQYAAWSS